jgi:D-sedoheptulose 7-phosphate isomerase
MQKSALSYYNQLHSCLDSIVVKDARSTEMSLGEGIEWTCNLILTRKESGNKLLFIGNGASAAISSHMATDFSKNVGIRATAFNDGVLLTCMGNDFGYNAVFEQPIKMFADKEDVLFAISSSGNSANILAAAEAAKTIGCTVITLSGFKTDNPLRSMGNMNFYVPAHDYGQVEVIHHSICHCILNTIVNIING